MGDWRYTYSENVLDGRGPNEIGILTDGHRHLFVHTVQMDDSPVTYVYDRIQSMVGFEEFLCVFPDTDDNWDALYGHLNSVGVNGLDSLFPDF